MEPPAPLQVVPDARLGLTAAQVLLKSDLSGDDFWPSLGYGLAVAILFLAAAHILFGSVGVAPAAFGFVCALIWLCLIQPRRTLRKAAAMWTAPPYRLEVDGDGLSATSDGGGFSRRWDRATGLLERDEYVIVAFDGLETLTIPAASFGSPEAREAWLAYVRERVPATALEPSSP